MTAGRSIAVIGGYGAVGRWVSLTAAQQFGLPVVVAGRDERRARLLALLAPDRLTPRRVDARSARDVRALLDTAAVVVMAVESGNEAVARACLERGVHYIDVSATSPVLAAVERLWPVAERGGAAAVLSVGLAPGLTNVLARSCLERLPSATAVDVTVLLGLKGDHGPDSLRWTLENLSVPVRRSPATPGRLRVDLPELGRRTAHPFPFSDQDTLTRTLGLPVTTRMCFDSAVVTAALFGLRRTGALRALHRLGATHRLADATSRLPLGGDRFVVHAAARDGRDAREWAAVAGHGECRATGLVAAFAADLVLRGRVPPGVHHLDQVADPGALLPALAEWDLSTWAGPPQPRRRAGTP